MKTGSTKQGITLCLFSPHCCTVEEITETGQAIIYYPIIASLGYSAGSLQQRIFAGHIKHNDDAES